MKCSGFLPIASRDSLDSALRRLKNADVLRGVIAAGLCVAIQVAALCAPLVHAHLDDHDGDHHAAALVHAHVGGHHSRHHESAATPVVVSEDDPEDATRLQIFVAVQAAAFTDPVLPPARFTFPQTLESNVARPPEVVRSHGPPESRPRASRAPPSFLS